MKKSVAVIAGAGPAGLTAAYELQKRTDIHPLVFEATDAIGGISRTHNYKGNRMDIGGHRFFTRVDRVMNWWFSILPLQGYPAVDTKERNQTIAYAVDVIVEHLLPREVSSATTDGLDSTQQGPGAEPQTKEPTSRFVRVTKKAPDPETADEVMLERSRLSRIFYRNVFFSYPLVFTVGVAWKLGIINSCLIVASYIKAQLFPIRNESTLDRFVINRFGKRLYEIFFKDYTEKVWGVPCSQIKSDWGAQRIKGLSLKNAIVHAIKDLVSREFRESLEKRETTLINRFFYPKFGPGQMWETVAKRVVAAGTQIQMEHPVTGLMIEDSKVVSASVIDRNSGKERTIPCDYFFSSMPIKHLLRMIDPKPDERILNIGEGLCYRDYITVGLLMKKLHIVEQGGVGPVGQLISKISNGNIEETASDNWIYIQDGRVKVGRVQIYNNWSPYLVANRNDTIWIGLEYFVSQGDSLWMKPDDQMVDFGISEMEAIKFLRKEDVLDSCVLRVEKTYPAYYGTYDQIGEIYDYVNNIDNLFLIGRNGLHKYNNQDHSMMTAMLAVDMIENGDTDKNVIFDYNIERVYQEQKMSDTSSIIDEVK